MINLHAFRILGKLMYNRFILPDMEGLLYV